MEQHHSSPVAVASGARAARRDMLREERHPNALTAPPVNRGSMAPQPWRGFWRSSGAALLSWLRPGSRRDRIGGIEEPWQRAARRRRLAFASLTLVTTVLASLLFASAQPDYGNAWLEYGQLALFSVLSAWVLSGFVTALMGFYVVLRGDEHALSAAQVRADVLAPDVRTALVMPICNEDVATVFAGLRATCESVAATGHAASFDVFILSDSSDAAIVGNERAAWAQLREALAADPRQPQIEIYYRLRSRRTHRKAGNVADFCRRWGRDYRYMVVLDADSVMSGDCLVAMVKLMEAHPSAGIIQTATQAIGHATLHARAQQFASRVTGRLFTLGMQYWQLGESHYWGHNAIIRIEPFMRHCALAPIPGRGGLAGPIMSHDFVEAALMRRAGYHVWLVSDLTGSYEQQPPDLLSELQRDRRWCQGNLQNARLIAEPGLHPVHRAMLAVGAMSYLSAPLWLAFLSLGTAFWLSDLADAPGWQPLPTELRALWAWTLSLLFMPRLLALAAVFMRRSQGGYGGASALLHSAATETALSLLQAPVRMLAHSLFVVVALTGIELHWQSPPRSANGIRWREAAQRLVPMTLVIGVLAAATMAVDAQAALWLAPVAVPLLLALPLAVLTSNPRLGARLRDQALLLIPEESRSPVVLRRAWHHAVAARNAWVRT